MVDNKKKPLSDKTTAIDAMIKDSDLNDYLAARAAEGRDIRLIDSDGTTYPYGTEVKKQA